jgi:hypothetical protein
MVTAAIPTEDVAPRMRIDWPDTNPSVATTEPQAVANDSDRAASSSQSSDAVIRVDRSSHERRRFAIFCPKVLADIETGSLPETVLDRGILIRMHRRRADESIERLRYSCGQAETQDLRDTLAIWGESVVELLRDAEPELPDELSDRQADDGSLHRR